MQCHPSDRPLDSELDVLFERGVKDEDTCCAVCGVPIIVAPTELREKNYRRYEWWTPCAIHAEDYEYDSVPGGNVWIGRPGHDVPVEVYGADDLEIEDIYCGPAEQTKLVNYTLQGKAYIGLHPKCLDMMQRLSSYRTTLRRHGVAIAGPRTLSQFYEVLQNRVCASKNRALQYSVTIRKPLEPHFYYFRRACICEARWPIGIPEVFEYEVEPYPIQSLTSEILSYLQPLPEGRRSGFSEKSILMKKLPMEIVEHICLHLHPFSDPGVACTYELSPNIWRDLLFRQQLLPWLWDLDPAILESQPLQHSNGQPSYSKDDFWDWEQLVRKLAQVEAFEPGNSLENAPLRLRNRKRIWRLLDEGRRFDIEDWIWDGKYQKELELFYERCEASGLILARDEDLNVLSGRPRK